ncbi:unnamed protein product [Lactuca virosa]|uniref:Proton-dependent oligopeptide transporter family n=1 Tax=Lactuca virosa TaxID=75947 RepID=A0AAU9N4H8_9ASTR|nr:unnamed protein product [Lactuca virosa]
MLQRIGIGILISIVSMVVAAVVETKRLETAREYGLLDDPNATIPMKIWWLLPQYLLAGAGDVFAIVGMQEFFYEQMPSDLKSMGLALYLSIIGIGSFLSSFLISIVGKMTGGDGEDGWICDNMNGGHIDYFYYLLAGISVGVFVMSKRECVDKRATEMDDNATTSYSTGVHTPLLNNFVDEAVDYRGRPAVSSKSGLWRSAYFVISNVNHSPLEIKIVVKGFF